MGLCKAFVEQNKRNVNAFNQRHEILPNWIQASDLRIIITRIFSEIFYRIMKEDIIEMKRRKITKKSSENNSKVE